MKIKLILTITLMLVLALVSSALADSAIAADRVGLEGKAFTEAVTAYTEGRYGDAQRGFKEIADSGVVNGHLYYNLGNAYMRTGMLGPAVLWYERAAALMPGDADLGFNLNYARTLIKDEQAEQVPAIERVVFFLSWMVPPLKLQYAAIALAALICFLLGLNAFVRHSTIRNMAIAAVVAGVLVLPSAIYSTTSLTNGSHGIVLGDSLPVRSGFADDSTVLFYLHAGTKVRIGEHRNGYYRISFGPDKMGWVGQEEIGLL